MALIRSLLHLLVMIITVIPYTTVILLVRLLGGSPAARYRVARAWLALCVDSARWIVGIRTRVEGMEHLPRDSTQGAVLLVKHQSAFETFLMPAIMPHPLAYVFKKELLRIPFFGWSIGSLDMIHIDRSQRARAFVHVIKRGKQLLGQGVWVIMFPEGTRIGARRKGHLPGQRRAPGHRGRRARRARGRHVGALLAAQGPGQEPGIVDVSIGRPIPTAGRKSDELMREVEDWIEAEMRRLDPEAYAAGAEGRLTMLLQGLLDLLGGAGDAPPASARLRQPGWSGRARRCWPGSAVPYSLQRARRRSIGFSVGPDGLAVRAPAWVTLAEVDAALQSKADWIVRKLAEQRLRREQQEAARIAWGHGARLPYLGQPLTVLLAGRQPARAPAAHQDQGAHALHLPLAQGSGAGRGARRRAGLADARCAPAFHRAARPLCAATGCALDAPAPVQRRHALGQRTQRRRHQPELAPDALPAGHHRLRGGARAGAPARDGPQPALLERGAQRGARPCRAAPPAARAAGAAVGLGEAQS